MRYYSIKKLAQLLGVSPRTVYNNWRRWKVKFGLRPLKIGNLVRFSSKDLKKLEIGFQGLIPCRDCGEPWEEKDLDQIGRCPNCQGITFGS